MVLYWDSIVEVIQDDLQRLKNVIVSSPSALLNESLIRLSSLKSTVETTTDTTTLSTAKALAETRDFISAISGAYTGNVGDALNRIEEHLSIYTSQFPYSSNTELIQIEERLKSVANSSARNAQTALDDILADYTTKTNQILTDIRASESQSGIIRVEGGPELRALSNSLSNLGPAIDKTTYPFAWDKAKAEVDLLLAAYRRIDPTGMDSLTKLLEGWALTASPQLAVDFLAGNVGGALVDSFTDPLKRASLAGVNRVAPNKVPDVNTIIAFQARSLIRDKGEYQFQRTENGDRLENDNFSFREYFRYMREAGYDYEWAKRFWGLHYELPGIGDAREMVYRLRPGTVSPEAVMTPLLYSDILKDHDIHPSFIPHYLATLYTPISRRDITRLVKLGLMSISEATERLMDLGLAPKDAKALAPTLNVEAEEGEVGLSKSEALSAYREGLLDRQGLISALRVIGIGENTVNLLINLEDSKIIKTRQREIEVQRKKFKALKDRLSISLRSGKISPELALTTLIDEGLTHEDAISLVNTVMSTVTWQAAPPQGGYPSPPP